MNTPAPPVRRLRVPRRRTLVAGLAAVALLSGGVALAGGPVPVLPVLPGGPVDVSPVNTNTANGSGVTTVAGIDLEVLTRNALDSTAVTAAPDGRVLYAEKTGAIKVVKKDGTTVEAGRLLTSCSGLLGLPGGCADPLLEEGGIHGLELARDFATTGRFFAYYSAAGTAGTTSSNPSELEFRLSSFVLKADSTIDSTSEKVLLSNPAEYTRCCHYGGDIDHLADGTILLSVGDDTSPRDEGWNPRDKRPGREAFDADRTSQNKKDRRGKVLRLMPDGSVPDGKTPGIAANPHVGDAAYDPYVYAMGFRSDYRIAVDEPTGTVYVGNIGPDARTLDVNRGPKGLDELETIPPGGGTNHGWPNCIGDNIAYKDYDYLTGTTKGTLSCEGMTPATMSYSYDAEPAQADLGSGGRASMAGLVYRPAPGATRALPERLHGSLLWMEWSRGTVFAIPVFPVGHEKAGQLDVSKREKLVTGLHGPIDMSIAPDGSVVVAEFGRGFGNNLDSRVVRLVPGEGGPQGQE